MADWPRRLAGHYVDRGLVSTTGVVAYRYHCLKCGLHLDEPEESALALRPCDSFAKRVGRGP